MIYKNENKTNFNIYKSSSIRLLKIQNNINSWINVCKESEKKSVTTNIEHQLTSQACKTSDIGV